MADDRFLAEQIHKIERLLAERAGERNFDDVMEAMMTGLAIAHEALGPGHPLSKALEAQVPQPYEVKIVGALKTMTAMYRAGRLSDPRLQIAREVEGDFLATAESTVKTADKATDPQARQVHLGVAAFLAGGVLEDGLRRLCDKHGLVYEAGNTSITKLVNLLYQPSKGVTHIDAGEMKHVTAWGGVRNKADHGHFDQLGLVEVSMMVTGVQDFLARKLS